MCKGKDEVLAAKEQEIAAKERALSDERQRVSWNKLCGIEETRQVAGSCS